MTNDLFRRGYAARRGRRCQRNRAACVQLIAAVALMLSLAVAVTAVSIGFARAGSATSQTTISR
jgi:hypothetical protein